MTDLCKHDHGPSCFIKLGVSYIDKILACHEQLSCVKSATLSQLLRCDLHTELHEVTEVCSPSLIGGMTYTKRNIDSTKTLLFRFGDQAKKIYGLLIVTFMFLDIELFTLAVNFKGFFFSHYAS